jgi:hypothetical protein
VIIYWENCACGPVCQRRSVRAVLILMSSDLAWRCCWVFLRQLTGLQFAWSLLKWSKSASRDLRPLSEELTYAMVRHHAWRSKHQTRRAWSCLRQLLKRNSLNMLLTFLPLPMAVQSCTTCLTCDTSSCSFDSLANIRKTKSRKRWNAAQCAIISLRT